MIDLIYSPQDIKKNRYEKLRAAKQDYVLTYLETHPCLDCGEADPIVLEFHHLRDKTRAVSLMMAGNTSVRRLAEEIDKCVVRCANCHRKHHRIGYKAQRTQHISPGNRSNETH